MSRILNFNVRLEFSDSIDSDQEIMEVAENIARAIKHEVNSGIGISPNDDAYTQSVTIKPLNIEKEIEVIMF